MALADLPRPLVIALPPGVAPDAGAEASLALLVAVRAALLDQRPHDAPLHEARFEIYRQASLAWEDRWRVARVADLEEWVAEAAAQRNDFETAWHAWRAGWWIRHLLSEKGEARELWSHSDAVMATLRALTGRTDR